jgi:hypothetical protein
MAWLFAISVTQHHAAAAAALLHTCMPPNIIKGCVVRKCIHNAADAAFIWGPATMADQYSCDH